MVAGGRAGAAAEQHEFAPAHLAAARGDYAGAVPVERGDIACVLDDDRVAISVFPAREDDHAAVRGHHWIAGPAIDIDARVRAAPASAESRGDPAARRPQQMASERARHHHAQGLGLNVPGDGPGLLFHLLDGPRVVFLFPHDAREHVLALGAFHGDVFLLLAGVFGDFFDALPGLAKIVVIRLHGVALLAQVQDH